MLSQLLGFRFIYDALDGVFGRRVVSVNKSVTRRNRLLGTTHRGAIYIKHRVDHEHLRDEHLCCRHLMHRALEVVSLKEILSLKSYNCVQREK